MHCIICHSTNNEILLNQEYYPYFTSPLSRQDKKEILNHYDKNELLNPLIIKICKDCGHSRLDPLPDLSILTELYSKYYTYPSPLKGDFYPERDNEFLKYFENKIMPFCDTKGLTSVMEIGCYDGYVLYHLQKKGFDVTGCDPSEGAEIGKEYGVNINREFFSAEKINEKKMKFDIVISRHFIEHVVNPEEWVAGLTKILNEDGVLIIETPNVQFYLKQGLPSVFSLQHLHGFSWLSLQHLLNKAGMKILAMENSSSNLITVAVRGTEYQEVSPDFFHSITSSFAQKVGDNKNRIKQFLSSYIGNNKIIGIWGAGGYGLATLLLYEVPFSYIDFFIDSDSRKWDMEYLDYSIQIISPERARQANPDLVIIASMYSESIQKNIKENNMNCAILSLFPEIQYSSTVT